MIQVYVAIIRLLTVPNGVAVLFLLNAGRNFSITSMDKDNVIYRNSRLSASLIVVGKKVCEVLRRSNRL